LKLHIKNYLMIDFFFALILLTEAVMSSHISDLPKTDMDQHCLRFSKSV
jgi:hypothetical protein